MRVAVLLAITALAACAHAPPRRVYQQPLPMRIEIESGHWVDRDAGVYELRLACYEPRAETWCSGGCETKVERAVTMCPSDPVTVTSATGASATALLTPGGVTRLEFGARVDEHLARVETGGRQLKFPEDDPTRLAPPSSVEARPPPPTTRRKSYAGTMLVADLGLIVGGYVLATVMPDSGGDESGQALAFVWTVGYLAVGTVVHLTYGNKSQAGLSILRRLFFPVGGAFLGGAAFSGDDCSESELCGLDVLIGVVLGGAAGMLTAIVWDAARAHVTVTATPVDHGGVVGVGARF